MMKVGFAAAVLGLCSLGCGDEEDETPASAFDQLVEGLGGQKDLNALTGLRIVGSGERNIPHEGPRPSNPAVEAGTFERTVSIDLSADSLRVDTTRSVEFLFPSTWWMSTAPAPPRTSIPTTSPPRSSRTRSPRWT